MLDWFSDQETLYWWVGIFSLLTFVGSLLLVPVLIVRIPEDYFVKDRRLFDQQARRHPVVRIVGLVLKNILGLLLLLAGVAMLALPGQGLLTILLGLMLINFPGKHALVRRLLSQPQVLRVINKIRARADHPPLRVEEDAAENEEEEPKPIVQAQAQRETETAPTGTAQPERTPSP